MSNRRWIEPTKCKDSSFTYRLYKLRKLLHATSAFFFDFNSAALCECAFLITFANFFAMPAVPDAATGDAERSSEADDDNETCVATGATGATTVNERPGPRR